MPAKRIRFSDVFADLQQQGIISRKRQRRDSSDTSEDDDGPFPQGTTNKQPKSGTSEASGSEPDPSTWDIFDANSEDKENRDSQSPTSDENYQNSGTTPASTAKSPQEKACNIVEKHALRPPCRCRRQCIQKINEERRMEIHKLFWELEYSQRRSWLFSQVKVIPKKRERSDTKGVHNRSNSRVYLLNDNEGQEKVVCKTFFLSTLGFTSDKIITVTLNSTSASALSPPCDRRGKHPPKHKLDETNNVLMETHINSFNPSISHYRRAHAPNRKYLPPELSMRDMYKDFLSRYPDIACYETYRKIIKSLNISFVKLGEEECEECLQFEKHQHQDGNADDCTTCTEWKEHIEYARISRRNYQLDVNEEHNDNTKYFSVDMQKVIMLPRLPGVKSSVFTRRLVLFHQTFAPLGTFKGSKSEKPTGVIWHEAISGRNAEDIVSAYSNIIHHPRYRDCKHFIFWTDNCTAQNKNWTLYTAMVNEVNVVGGPESVTFKYLEKGHTFMSADSFHAQVEKEMRAAKNVYDMNDFENIVNKIGNAMSLNYSDFRDWENGVSQGKFTNKPMLSSIRVAKFCRGCCKLLWKSSHAEEEFQSGDFLKKKLVDRILKGSIVFKYKEKPRGVTETKKSDILNKLCKLMPANRVQFWVDLPTSEQSADLIDTE